MNPLYKLDSNKSYTVLGVGRSGTSVLQAHLGEVLGHYTPVEWLPGYFSDEMLSKPARDVIDETWPKPIDKRLVLPKVTLRGLRHVPVFTVAVPEHLNQTQVTGIFIWRRLIDIIRSEQVCRITKVYSSGASEVSQINWPTQLDPDPEVVEMIVANHRSLIKMRNLCQYAIDVTYEQVSEFVKDRSHEYAVLNQWYPEWDSKAVHRMIEEELKKYR